MLVQIGNYLDVKRGASLSREFYSERGKFIRLTLGNFDYPNKGFKENTSKKDIYFIGDIKQKFILKKGDIITPLTEQVSGLLGETAWIPEDNKYIQSGDVGLVIPNERVLDKKFCYYLLQSPIIKGQLGAGAQQTKIRHTSPDKIKDCVAIIPTKENQIKIGKILYDIDSQINRNETVVKRLQVLSHNIFNYYYCNNDKTKIKLKDIAYMYQPETITGSDFVKDGKYPVYGSGGIIGRYNRYNHTESELMISCRGLCGNITLSLPFSWIIGNQMIIKLNDKKFKYYLYNYFQIINLKKVETGSVQKQITRTNLENLDVEILDDNLISIIANALEPIHFELIKIIKFNDKLIDLKNKLLPLLINQQLM